jgi:hypothetical protein
MTAGLASDLSVSVNVKDDVVLAVVALMGFLNKTMDGLGIPLEHGVVKTARGFGNSWPVGKHGAGVPVEETPVKVATSLKVLKFLPNALSFDIIELCSLSYASERLFPVIQFSSAVKSF